MRNVFKLNVKNKLILSFAVILLIPNLVIGLMSYQSAKDKVGEQMMQSATENIQLLSQVIDNFIEPQMKNIDYLSRGVANESYQGAEPPIWQMLAKFHALHPEISTIYVGTETGAFYNAPQIKMADGYDPRQRPWYQDAMKNKGKVIITSPFVSKTTGDFVVGIAKSTSDASGVLAAEIKLKNLSENTKAVKIGQEGYVYILDNARKFLVHPVNEIGSEAKEQQHLEMFKSESGKVEYTDATGQLRELAFITNKITGWKIAGTMYKKEVSNETGGILIKTLIVMAVAVAVGAVLIFTIVTSITRPLKELMNVSAKISQGDLTQRIIVKSNDELGKLGISFNQMTEALRSVITEVGETANQLAASSEELTASAEQTSKATEQIAFTIQEVAEGSEKQVRSVEDSSKVINEMSTGVQQIAANSQMASSVATQTAELALEGNKAIQTAVKQMNSINRTVTGLAEMVKGLGEHSREIGQIVEVITTIAEQTNLLALNAAIEAARAGEHGRGFAVVADEVRKLAEQSAESAQQIAQLISNIQAETNKAVQSMETGTKEVADGIGVVNEAGASFEQIQRSVNEVANQILEVSAATQQMSAGTVKVVNSIELITKVSESTSAGTQNVSAAAEEQLASMEEISSSATSLSRMAVELQEMVNRFRV